MRANVSDQSGGNVGVKKSGAGCLNIASEECNSVSREDIIDQCPRIMPIPVSIDSSMSAISSGQAGQHQQFSMRHFVKHWRGREEPNSG